MNSLLLIFPNLSLTIRYHGDKTKCLSLYKRAVDRVYDDAEKVFESFLSFERLEGSLDSVVTAEERICAKREKLERKKEKMAEPREKEMVNWWCLLDSTY